VEDDELRNDGVARHRALGDTSRMALLGVLQGASGPLDVPALSERVGLHANTVRWHLRVLARAGLVVEERVGSGARGRPRHGYRVVEGGLAGGQGGFGLLAEVLVDALAHRGRDVAGAVEAAGKARGRRLVPPRLGEARAEAGEAFGVIVRLLEGFGFRPRLDRTDEGARVSMRPCPFGDLAARHSSIVCPAHLGLMRGTLEVLKAPVEATSLEPFAEPDLCVAHFRVTQKDR
jgi:predicted ArsR family transcriptional regulator